MKIKNLKIKLVYFCTFILSFLIISCESQPINPYDEAAKPYAPFGIEGHMGAVMTSCLGMPPQSPPIKTSSKGPLIEHKNYFDCVDDELLKKEERDRDNR